MDNKDNQIQVSLPGAGGTEPSILEVLNRSIASECDNEATADPQDSQSNLVDVGSDDSAQVINDNLLVDDDVEFVAQVTDLDVDDNQISDSNVLQLESHLITEDSSLDESTSIEIVGETLPETETESESLSTIKETESDKCDRSSVSSENINVLEEERLPKSDSFTISTHQEEGKQVGSSDENKQLAEAVHLPELIAETENRYKHQYEHLDPEDQKIILEAIESSILNSARQYDDAELEAELKPQISQEFILKDPLPTLQSPYLLLSNTTLQEQHHPEQTLESDSPQSAEPTTPIFESSQTIPVEPLEEEVPIQTNIVEIDEDAPEPKTTATSDVTESQIEITEFEISSPQPDPESSKIQTSPPPPKVINPQLETPAKHRVDPSEQPIQNPDNESHSQFASEALHLSTEAKREYYQHLRDYLDHEDINRPPIPLQTYRWEDVRRARQQGGYPWTHLYKRPLGPDEEPVITALRRSHERQKFSSESPRSSKKVRIHEEVLVKETERYICDLSDNETDDDDDNEEEEEDDLENQRETAENQQQAREDQRCHSEPEDTYSVQSEPISISASASDTDGKSWKISRLKGILKRRLSARQAQPDSSPDSQAAQDKPTANKKNPTDSPKKAKCCRPIMDKLKSMADRQLKKRNIKKVPLKDNEKIVLSEKQKILRLKSSPKADHGTIPHFVEKQDSDDILEILELEESPSKNRKRRDGQDPEEVSILIPDEIIELPTTTAPQTDAEAVQTALQVDDAQKDEQEQEPTVSEILEEELRLIIKPPPKKAPRRRKEHIYEDIDDEDLEAKIDEILQEAVESVVKISQQIQEEKLRASPDTETSNKSHLREEILRIVEDHEKDELLEAKEPELKSAMRREPSPVSDKKVTFSHVEDEAEPHREDIVLPEEYRTPSRWSNTGDHEYEPIGQPLEENHRMDVQKEASPIPTLQISEPMETEVSGAPDTTSLTSMERKELDDEHEPSAFEQQQDLEERYFSSIPTTPRNDSRTDNEIHTSQVDSSALEELPLKAENRKKGFMASAQDRSRKMQQNIRSQAGKIRTKIRGSKKPVSGSPKAKERKRFKGPDFSKIKMPDIKRPELPKFKAPEFKRPEFTKFEKPIFTKPDMSKFKIPDTMTLKLRRSKSLKETEVVTSESGSTHDMPPTPKKKFEFNFGTYPRMLRKRKQKLSTVVIARADDAPSTETPPSVESATLPRQEKGPVSSRWADKFSDVSYADSESGKYQRYGSEPESLGRESSMERRMKEDLERTAREEEELENMHTVDQKQFADYDEENRAIHEISKIREGEFRQRRPMVHQDSDLVSEESKEVGWSEKDILRNTILRRDEADVEHLQEPEKYQSEEGLGGSNTNTNQETQSTGSSGILRQKGVIEEIDDDEFFLRKRGISQDNIEIRQYISSAIREGLGTPINTLAQLGTTQNYYPDMDVSNEQVNYGYDVPPPKPRRAHHKHFNNFDRDRDTESRDVSQDFELERKGSYDDNMSLPQAGNEYFRNIAPSRPLRKSRQQYSHDSQEDHEVPSEDIPYLDEDEDKVFFKKMNIQNYALHQDDEEEENLEDEIKLVPPPQAPKRRKKQQRESIEKDSYANRFSGRSVSNSFLPSEERDEDFIVYRTQHEYIIPLAQGETFTAPAPNPRRSRSRSQSRMTDDDRTSRGADSFASESLPIVEDKFHIDMKESDGYATVRKDPPPRPPAPNRRKRSSSPQVERQFSTMPHSKRESTVPDRPKRNYSTIGPTRPPRRKSSASMVEAQKNISSPDVTQYEELDLDEDEDRMESPRDLHSGDVINKMKYRPLPPPPRPPRDGKKLHRDPKDSSDDKDDKDDGTERIISDIQRNGNYDIDKPTEKCIEVEVSTQTDPLPDDFCCEEFEITPDMRIIEPRCTKTLQDILKEEQEAEIERARQLADEESLNRGLQRFREAGQRSYSERSKGSTADRSKASLSRPTTPSAVVLERRIPTPIPNRQGETMLEASIIVLPVDDIDLEDEQLEEKREERNQPQQQSSLETEETIESESGERTQEEEQRLTTDQSEDDQETHHSAVYESSLDREEEIVETEEDIVETEEEPPPIPPPRKRSSIPADTSSIEERESVEEIALLSTTLEIEPHEEQRGESTPVLPSRLAIADLEVERLSVNALQAGRIIVSQLHGSSITTDELDCKSGNIVARNLEFPPGFIEEIIERVRSSERPHSQAETQTTEPSEQQPVEQQPLPQQQQQQQQQPPQQYQPQPQQSPLFPSEYMQYSIPPQSFYSLRNPSEEEHHHSPTHRRRRHHRRRDSTSEDESHRELRRSRHSTRSPEPSIGQLGGQLLNACGTSILRTMNQIANILRANDKEGNDRNISTAIIIVILMTIGFLLLGIAGDKNIHHHHWDYFNPPGNQGR